MKDRRVDLCDGAEGDRDASLSTSLLTLLRAGDEAAWQRWAYLYGPVVEQWCRRGGLQEQDAADVVQDVFAAVMAGMEDFRREREGDTFRGWLWTVTRNKLRDHWRRRAQRPDAAGGTEAQIRLAEVPDELSAEWSTAAVAMPHSGLFRRALALIQANFEERTWQAFWQTTVDERSAADVAAALGMSAGAVYVAKSRVLNRLREELGDFLDE
jgi:RNA polymerase sigma-70 factor (ECF subfamily)